MAGIVPWAAGRLELTNSCLSSLPLFAMSMYLLHDGTHKAMDRPRSRFFWEGVGDKRKYHMVDWATVCKPKVLGGLGVMNTKSMNIALMVKWIWKLYQGAEGLWADLIRTKYLRGRDLYAGQCWRVLVRQRVRDLLDLAVGGVRRLYARTRSEST
ncbi:hypothetical protein QYE76_034635 [Lolium multiflorum]|uniref:Reverse transcriptase zinc-binding domain-containing protein n=1 Tax=Lolium multiflorum TaxID=4521 RepID=A0AAD8QZI1_LOLMU|nr:hypothetical protein QYE76_034635 [Lolium multiflorum]